MNCFKSTTTNSDFVLSFRPPRFSWFARFTSTAKSAAVNTGLIVTVSLYLIALFIKTLVSPLSTFGSALLNAPTTECSLSLCGQSH